MSELLRARFWQVLYHLLSWPEVLLGRLAWECEWRWLQAQGRYEEKMLAPMLATRAPDGHD